MCRPATCTTCGRATYAGCGQHVEQVLAGVPVADRCSCSRAEPTTGGPARLSGLLRRLLGR